MPSLRHIPGGNIFRVAVATCFIGYCLNGVAAPTAAQIDATLKAAEEGNAVAQSNLGIMYAKGDGVSKDLVKASEWYQKAAVQGNAQAQSNLGLMYVKGDGVPKDWAKAFEWIQKAAVQDYAQAQYNLGLMYARGDGVPKDLVKASEWYQKAAVNGSAQAQFTLGLMHGRGDGVPKDWAKAFEWIQKAAVQGDAQAQFHLGIVYAKGNGVPKDLMLAYAWTDLAARSGVSDAAKNRDIAESLLSKAELTDARRLSSEWRKGQVLTRTKLAIDSKNSQEPLPSGITPVIGTIAIRYAPNFASRCTKKSYVKKPGDISGETRSETDTTKIIEESGRTKISWATPVGANYVGWSADLDRDGSLLPSTFNIQTDSPLLSDEAKSTLQKTMKYMGNHISKISGGFSGLIAVPLTQGSSVFSDICAMLPTMTTDSQSGGFVVIGTSVINGRESLIVSGVQTSVCTVETKQISFQMKGWSAVDLQSGLQAAGSIGGTVGKADGVSTIIVNGECTITGAPIRPHVK